MLKQLALATFAATALLAVQSSANAGRCGDECIISGSGANGHQGVLLSGVTLEQKADSESVVNAVILPTGEVIDLR